jgi:ATP-dependent DNA helicase RecQ
VFGAGKEFAASWQSIYRQLLAMNLIRVEHDEAGAKLQESAAAVFKWERSVTLRRDRSVARGATRSSEGSNYSSRSGLSTHDREVFEAFRKECLAIAKKLGVAPYVIFPGTTLIAFASSRPATLGEMLEISGVGPNKLERYEARFLDVLEIALRQICGCLDVRSIIGKRGIGRRTVLSGLLRNMSWTSISALNAR